MKPAKSESWTKPPNEVLKLNCDGSFRADDQSGSWGFIIRYWDGDVVMTGRGRVNHLLSALHAELIACLHGVQAALNLGIGRLILETDALTIQQELLSSAACDRQEGGLVDELRSLVSANFLFFKCILALRAVLVMPLLMLWQLWVECVEGEEIISDSVPSDVHVIVEA